MCAPQARVAARRGAAAVPSVFAAAASIATRAAVTAVGLQKLAPLFECIGNVTSDQYLSDTNKLVSIHTPLIVGFRFQKQIHTEYWYYIPYKANCCLVFSSTAEKSEN